MSPTMDSMCRLIKSNDKYMTSVLASDEHVVHYKYNERTNVWIGDGVEGVYLITERSLTPFHLLMFLGVPVKESRKPYYVTRAVNGDWNCDRDGPYVYLRAPGNNADTFKFGSIKAAAECHAVFERLILWHRERSKPPAPPRRKVERPPPPAAEAASSTTASSDDDYCVESSSSSSSSSSSPSASSSSSSSSSPSASSSASASAPASASASSPLCVSSACSSAAPSLLSSGKKLAFYNSTVNDKMVGELLRLSMRV